MLRTQSIIYPILGNIFVVSAPSGAGKSTLVNNLLQQDKSIKLSVSHTTRPPRTNEKNGQEYHFMTLEAFHARRNQGEFLEYAKVHSNYYGTSYLTVNEIIRSGEDILLEIDWQGARKIKEVFPHAVGIFILPPSISILEERLRKRGQDKREVINHRMLAAKSEISHAPEFEYLILNEDISSASSELIAIVKATRCRFPNKAVRNLSLFTQLGMNTPT